MELVFPDANTETICSSLKAAQRFFGGNQLLARSLLARINAFNSADTLKDIVVNPVNHFHNLKNKAGRNLEGYFGVDVKSRAEAWRIILRPLDEKKCPYNPCEIDKIAQSVKIIEITEVSKHYE